jgi:hypothetical protein
MKYIVAILGMFAAANAALAGVSTESPFAPRGLLAGAQNTSPIELRGITSDEQGLRFAIYDPAKKDGAWVRIDEKGHPYVIRSYDAATNRVAVDYQGRSQTLVLAEPKFGPAPRPAGVPIPGQMQAQPGAPMSRADRIAEMRAQHQGGQQQAQAQPSQQENARLEAIRAEIARRRGTARPAGQ